MAGPSLCYAREGRFRTWRKGQAMPEDVWSLNAGVRFMDCFNLFASGKHWELPRKSSVYRPVLNCW